MTRSIVLRNSARTLIWKIESSTYASRGLYFDVLSKLLQDFSMISISYYRQLFGMIHKKRKLLSDDAVLGFENAMIIRAR